MDRGRCVAGGGVGCLGEGLGEFRGYQKRVLGVVRG